MNKLIERILGVGMILLGIYAILGIIPKEGMGFLSKGLGGLNVLFGYQLTK